jgi:peptide/nickel transport system substrate-binding protein
MTFRSALLVCALGASLVAAPAMAQKSADTLRVVFRDAVTNVDPYFNQLRTGVVISHQAWDGLVYRDPDTFQIKPLLATSWKLVDDKTIEFDLRRGVKFHNGDPFTADDVVYTLNTVSAADSKVSVPSNVNWIERAEKLDDFKVRVHLKRPQPAAFEYFAFVVPIWPKAYRERVGAEGYSKSPVGTGPYRFTKVDAATLELERFADYYADSPRGKPAIGKMQIRFVPDAATEMTELLAGRTGDASPFKNVKVRQAVFHAIDREQIAKQLVQGGSRVPPAPCFPTQFGCDGEAAVNYAFDPAKAKALLAEAGYPNGFDTEIVSYVLPQWGASVQGFLNAVGIRAKLSQLQVQAVVQRNQRGESPSNLGSWGSFSINDVSAIMPVYFGGGADDYSRDPDLIKLLEQAGSTMDAAARKVAYSAVIKRATEQAYWVPLHTYVTTYGLSRNLELKTYPDELPRFWLSKWK